MQHEDVKGTFGLTRVIAASSAGTLIEWYDFYIFGSLATVLAGQFFPKGNPTAAFLGTLATLATGFVVRPFGALFFGRMGDIVGRKYTFLVTLLTMGLSTILIGLVPKYETIGVLAPIAVVLLRMIQGLALGGEYGGAAIYVAEHAPAHRQGFYTSFIQITATMGFFVSLVVLLAVRSLMPEAAFTDWGWRVPFLLSSVLVIFSYLIRRRMNESPVFAAIKAQGKASKSPIKDSLGDPANLKLVLIALFGAMAGQAVVFYTGHLYSLYFLQTVMNVSTGAASKMLAWALLFASPFYIGFAALSDRIGRKPLIVCGCLFAVICYLPVYSQMQNVGRIDGPPVVSILRDFDVKTGKATVSFVQTTTRDDGSTKKVSQKMVPDDPTKPLDPKEKPKTEVTLSSGASLQITFLLWIQIFFSAMCYAPIAAFLVAMFPPRIRYTSLSVPYHIGNGVFGGLVPLVASGIVAATGNPLSGLIYPMAIAGVTVIVGALFIKEKKTPEGFAEVAT